MDRGEGQRSWCAKKKQRKGGRQGGEEEGTGWLVFQHREILTLDSLHEKFNSQSLAHFEDRPRLAFRLVLCWTGLIYHSVDMCGYMWMQQVWPSLPDSTLCWSADWGFRFQKTVSTWTFFFSPPRHYQSTPSTWNEGRLWVQSSLVNLRRKKALILRQKSLETLRGSSLFAVRHLHT